VDDDEMFLDLSEQMLRRQDTPFEVETAVGAEAGLEYLHEQSGGVDCVVCDYEMPKKSGIDVLREVRSTHPELPFILFTGKGSEEVASEAISEGVSDYVEKGAGRDRFAVLANRIRNHLDKVAAEAAARRYNSRREESEWFRQRMTEIISDDRLSDDETAEQLLDLGCERFGTATGLVGLTDATAGRHETIATDGDSGFETGVRDLSATYCRRNIAQEAPLTISHAAEEGWADTEAYERHGVESYLGQRLEAGGEVLGSLCFIDGEPQGPFGHHEQAFLDLLVRWFSQYAERRQRGDSRRSAVSLLKRLFEVELDPTMSFEAKVGELLATAASCLDLEYGVVAELSLPDDPEVANGRVLDGTYEVVEAYGDHSGQRGLSLPIEETLCQAAVGMNGATVLEDTHQKEWDTASGAVEEEWRCYIGDEIRVDGELFGTICFGGSTPREEPFTPLERSFLQSLASRLGYELSVHRREAELRRKNKRLERFATVVSHDLQNPLNIARGHLELARERVTDSHLEDVEAAHDRMETLIDDLLALAEQRESVDTTQRVELADLVERAAAGLAAEDAVLEIEDAGVVQADPSRLRQLVSNLVANAVDHNDGPVAIRVGRQSDGFYVADDGCGIPADRRDAVFEGGHSTAEKGTGFGLQIVQAVAEAHGWDVQVTESASGGARFEFGGVDPADDDTEFCGESANPSGSADD
jgi:DNA-binding NarL/FixJ family response regulator/two-component sensor histidine kinase